MSNASPLNPNLQLTNEADFKGLPIYTSRGPLVVGCLERILLTINKSLSEHPRTLAVRFDLRVPVRYIENLDSSVITRFFESLKKQIACDTARKQAKGTRVHPCSVRYAWVKESTDEFGYPHYHVLLLLNRDRFHCLGDYGAKQGNLAARIKKAWASALGLQQSKTMGAVHFPENCLYALDINSDTFNEVYPALFFRASYMAKLETKRYGEGSRSFGTSRN
ncbi:inovirus Gp2 family protein [Aliidiomarina minuta]|uniref:Inovirus Gp2 family protein n=1 Tax=Aliidiomarina minuta TaxID=880057 RepID=A0A432W7E6_9GAMM|nr:inovirus Gp2 family protein [Aliidiomarina minuta]RUO25998.1 inovirus Gp2 family protein [Aliidiomarina minuta]